MSYLVEIAHANDVILNKWKIVDTLDDLSSIQDIIASPHFEWEHTTVIRVRRSDGQYTYTGIYGDSACIDVGPQSDFIKNNPWRFNGNNMAPLINQSFVQRWVESKSAGEMIYGISKIIDEKTILRLLHRCLWSYLLPQINATPLALEAMDTLQAYLEDRASVKAVVGISDRLYEYGSVANWINAIVDTCQIVANYTTASSAMMEIVVSGAQYLGRSYEEIDEQIAEEIRRDIPFYDVAAGITA